MVLERRTELSRERLFSWLRFSLWFSKKSKWNCNFFLRDWLSLVLYQIRSRQSTHSSWSQWGDTTPISWCIYTSSFGCIYTWLWGCSLLLVGLLYTRCLFCVSCRVSFHPACRFTSSAFLASHVASDRRMRCLCWLLRSLHSHRYPLTHQKRKDFRRGRRLHPRSDFSLCCKSFNHRVFPDLKNEFLASTPSIFIYSKHLCGVSPSLPVYVLMWVKDHRQVRSLF